mmetsp:Transcript_21355/g.48782  ORF Transcript_21355/g.48782 Transcript_21355/m.48782 type:complete len:231 (+) Transcript_21355:28-720(+)
MNEDHPWYLANHSLPLPDDNRCGLQREGQRRVVRNDPQLAVLALEEGPSLVHLGDSAGLVGYEDVSHRNGHVAFNENSAVDDFHLAPTLERKTLVAREGWVVAHKVGQGAFTRGAEGLVPASERGLEEHRPIIVPVGRVYHIPRQSLGRCQAMVLVGQGYAHQGVPPSLLGSQHFLLRDPGAQLDARIRPGLIHHCEEQQRSCQDGNPGGTHVERRGHSKLIRLARADVA